MGVLRREDVSLAVISRLEGDGYGRKVGWATFQVKGRAAPEPGRARNL